MNHGWQSEATDGPRAAKRKESAKRKKSADRSGKHFSTPETWTVECNCRRIFANIWFSQVWKHSSYTHAIPWCFKIWAWLRHEFLETAIPWWFTSKFWPRHELGMSLSFDCTCWTSPAVLRRSVGQSSAVWRCHDMCQGYQLVSKSAQNERRMWAISEMLYLLLSVMLLGTFWETWQTWSHLYKCLGLRKSCVQSW